MGTQAMQANFNSRLLATWEALEEMYNPTEVELQDLCPGLHSPVTDAGGGNGGSGGNRGSGGVGSGGNARGGVGGGSGHRQVQTDRNLGLHGLGSTDAKALLAEWKANAAGRQPAPVELIQFCDDDVRTIRQGKAEGRGREPPDTLASRHPCIQTPLHPGTLASRHPDLPTPWLATLPGGGARACVFSCNHTQSYNPTILPNPTILQSYPCLRTLLQPEGGLLRGPLALDGSYPFPRWPCAHSCDELNSPLIRMVSPVACSQDEEIGGGGAGGGSVRRRMGKKAVDRVRNARSMSHMRKSVYARKATLQLVSVS